jgi:hypothetical protein
LNLKTEGFAMAHRLLLAYAFVRRESEQNSSPLTRVERTSESLGAQRRSRLNTMEYSRSIISLLNVVLYDKPEIKTRRASN